MTGRRRAPYRSQWVKAVSAKEVAAMMLDWLSAYKKSSIGGDKQKSTKAWSMKDKTVLARCTNIKIGTKGSASTNAKLGLVVASTTRNIPKDPQEKQ